MSTKMVKETRVATLSHGRLTLLELAEQLEACRRGGINGISF
jgi:hypothetical protein